MSLYECEICPCPTALADVAIRVAVSSRRVEPRVDECGLQTTSLVGLFCHIVGLF